MLEHTDSRNLEQHLLKESNFSKVASCRYITPLKMKPPHAEIWTASAEKLCNKAAYHRTHVSVKSLSMAACNVLQRCFQDPIKFSK